MRKIIGTLLLIGFLLPQTVLADGIIIPPPDQNITQAQQRALIVHQSGVEDLIISLEVSGDASQFAWFLPVPEKPEIKRGDDEIFTKLAELTRPKKNLLDKIKGERKYYPVPLFGEIGRGVPEEEKVEVIETKRVGILDVSVLQATKAADLEEWLKENGYKMPDYPEGLAKPIPLSEEEVFSPPSEQRVAINRARQIFQEYLDKGWYFVAAKIATEFLEELPKVTPRLKLPLGVEEKKMEMIYPVPPQYYGQAHITPLHLTFKTEKIVYPMKITSLSQDSPSVLLYVLVDHKKTVSNYKYQYIQEEGGEENLIFKTKYAAKIRSEELKEWLPKAKDGFLTQLYASYLSSTQMGQDLRFENAKDDKTVNAGEMRKKDWLVLPFYFVIYGPIRILEWFAGGQADYYWPLGQLLPIIPLIFISFLGGGGLLWVALFYFFLSRTRGRIKRAVLYILQFPGVWVLVNLLSLIFVIPCLIVLLLLKVEPGIMLIHLLLKNNLGVVFFTALFYALQAKIHLFSQK